MTASLLASAYVPVREAAYGALLATAFIVWQRPSLSMYGVAAVSVLLMFIGIHNAWDVAVWNSVRKQKEEQEN